MVSSKEEQSGVVWFLAAEGAETRELHRLMSDVYGEHSMSLTNVHEWHKSFREGCTSLQDNPCPGQAHRAIIPDVFAQIDILSVKNEGRNSHSGY